MAERFAPIRKKERPVFTFYSFKGGVGRTMALINSAVILAKRNRRVLAIDLDLEAPGISYLSPSGGVVRGAYGFVDAVHHFLTAPEQSPFLQTVEKDPLLPYVRRFYEEKRPGESPTGYVDIMPAGHLENFSNYQKKLNEIDLRNLYTKGYGKPFLRFFKQLLCERTEYDYILVDSRTGFSDEAGIAIRDLADHLIIVLGLNHQNVEGTAAILRAVREGHEQDYHPKISITCVASPVPLGEHDLFKERSEEAEADLNRAWRPGQPPEQLLKVLIPYSPFLALSERLHLFLRPDHPLTESYRKLASEIQRLAGDTPAHCAERLSEALQDRELDKALASLCELADYDNAESRLQLTMWLGGIADSRLDESHSMLLQRFARRRGFPRAIEHLRDYLPTSATPWNAFEQLAHLHLLAGHPEEAEAELGRAIRRFHDAPKLHRAYGDVLWLHRAQPDDAEAAYRRAMERGGRQPNYYRALAVFIWRERHNLHHAFIMFEKAGERGGRRNAHYLRSYASFLWQERYQLIDQGIWSDSADALIKQARDDFERALQLDGHNAAPHYHYAEMLLAINIPSSARDHLEKAWQYRHSVRRWAQCLIPLGAGILQRLEGRNDSAALKILATLFEMGVVPERYSACALFQDRLPDLSPEDQTLYRSLADCCTGRQSPKALRHPRWPKSTGNGMPKSPFPITDVD